MAVEAGHRRGQPQGQHRVNQADGGEKLHPFGADFSAAFAVCYHYAKGYLASCARSGRNYDKRHSLTAGERRCGQVVPDTPGIALEKCHAFPCVHTTAAPDGHNRLAAPFPAQGGYAVDHRIRRVCWDIAANGNGAAGRTQALQDVGQQPGSLNVPVADDKHLIYPAILKQRAHDSAAARANIGVDRCGHAHVLNKAHKNYFSPSLDVSNGRFLERHCAAASHAPSPAHWDGWAEIRGNGIRRPHRWSVR